MATSAFRLVLDTNILVRGFINLDSDSGRIIKLCGQRRILPLISNSVVREYRVVLGDAKLCSRYPQLKRPDVAVALERLIYVGDVYRRVRARFEYAHDPKDSHLIELAIAGGATQLITMDDDLLSLPHGRNDPARRFRQRLPNAEVLTPYDFLKIYRDDLGLE